MTTAPPPAAAGTSGAPGALPGAAPADPQAAARAATLLVADTIGELMGFWNFKPSMGKVWTVLYLSQDPLCADEIADRSGLSAGSVSMTVHELLAWGVIRPAWRAGSRKRHYAAETDILAMVTRVFRDREQALIQRAVAQLHEAMTLLESVDKQASPGILIQYRFLLGRVQRLHALARAGRAVVERFAKGGLLDLRGLRDALGRPH